MKVEPFYSPSFMPMVILYGLALIALFGAGIFIGFFRRQDGYVALLLFIITIVVILFAFLYMGSSKQFVIFTLGVVLAGGLGMVAEIWGTTNGFWFYHDLSGDRHLPYWLPFAWALAFTFIYTVERLTIHLLQLKSVRAKWALAILLAAFLPTWGEMVAINAGVWTYTWPRQIFGVPVLAIFLLVLFHTGIRTLLWLVCHRYKIIDPVFNNFNEVLIDDRVIRML